MPVLVKRRDVKFLPDPSRVIVRFLYINAARSANVIKAVMGMSDPDVTHVLGQALRNFSLRHRNISRIFEKHFDRISSLFPQLGIDPETLNLSRKLLIGSYFTMEYAIEAAAFFNPSVVEHPDQTGLRNGDKRVIISFRATGEGHISSIVFRTGVLDKLSDLTLEPVGKMIEEAEHIRRHLYNKESFKRKLDEMLEFNTIIPSDLIMDTLPDKFTYGELRNAISTARTTLHLAADKELLFNQIIWLASSHYELEFSFDTHISERVIFPVSATERNGIEDARFLKFIEEDGSFQYYATYTAYSGIAIMPKLLSTRDFYHFKISPLHGEIAHSKGMALFPRKINQKYAMLCRLDGFNNYISFSDKINIWREGKLLQEPKFPWEFVQIGNCGSPVETPEGWLVITHGVGPMREYVLGASLFDLQDPEKEIGRLNRPLLVPNMAEREGYVPNVVYSCGSMIHNNDLILPYAMSDYGSTYATLDVRELLNALKNSTTNAVITQTA